MILETKLTLPQPKAGALLRTGLIELIKNNLDKKLILICADAGYGKTTLLAQLIRAAALPCVFYDLDKGDSDLLTFYSYVIAGLEKLSPGLATRSAGLLAQGSQIGNNYELLMGTLINELLEKRKEEVFFILDDYQHLTASSLVPQAIEYFIDHLPDTVHVIIASRSAVQYASLAKWFARQDAFEANRGDLCFTESEVNELLAKSYGQTLSDEDLKSLLDHTEGWITGIQLILAQAPKPEQGAPVKDILDAYRQAGFNRGDVFHYFSKEIFARESEPIKMFLEKTAIFDLLEPEACNEILEIEDSAWLLEELEKRNLFLAQIGTGKYKYHRLFRDFLQSRQRDDRETASLHEKAGDYYRKKGMPEPAIEHYLQAKSYAQAAQVIALIGRELEIKAQYARLEKWLEQLPEEILEKESALLTIRGEVFQDAGDFQAAAQMYARAASASKQDNNRFDFANALYDQGNLLWVRGLYKDALGLFKQALKYCPPKEKDLMSIIFNDLGLVYLNLVQLSRSKECFEKAGDLIERKDHFNYLSVLSHLAIVQAKKGNMQAAFGQYQRLIELIAGRYYFKIGIFFGNAAKIAMESGQQDWARQTLEQGWALCRDYKDDWSLCSLQYCQGNYHIQTGQWEPAGACLKQALDQAIFLKWQAIELAALKDLARLHRYRGNYTYAQQYLEMAKQKITNLDSLEGAYYASACSHLALAQKQFLQAGEFASQALKLSEKYKWKVGVFHAQLVKAGVRLGLGNNKCALYLMAEAVRNSRLKGYDGILVRELRSNSILADLAFACPEKKYLDPLRLSIFPQVGEAAAGIDLAAYLFGSLRLCLPDGREIPLKFRYTKCVSLLAYVLLHRDRICLRDELMEKLWPRLAPRLADRNLRDSVCALKKTLAAGFQSTGRLKLKNVPLIEHAGKGYRLAQALRCRSDTEEFTALFEKASAVEKQGMVDESRHNYRRCAELAKNNLLDNVEDQWCEEYRRKFQKMRQTALQQLAAASLESNEHLLAIEYCSDYLDADPYSEQLHIILWKALKAIGRQKEIRQDYENLQRILRKDLSAKLQVKTVRIFHEIVDNN